VRINFAPPNFPQWRGDAEKKEKGTADEENENGIFFKLQSACICVICG
jgi:hypothetical protein